MSMDLTVNFGVIIQTAVIIIGGAYSYAFLKAKIESIESGLKNLAKLPEHLARHDERIKNLERRP